MTWLDTAKIISEAVAQVVFSTRVFKFNLLKMDIFHGNGLKSLSKHLNARQEFETHSTVIKKKTVCIYLS